MPPHPSEPPHIRFLFVEHAFCYRLPPDLVLPLRHCRVANPSPHRAGSGFAPYRSAPCWAHTHKADNLAAAGPSPFGYDRVRIIHNKTTMTRTVSIFKSPFQITTSCGIIFHEARNVVTISFLICQTRPVLPTRALSFLIPLAGPITASRRNSVLRSLIDAKPGRGL